ncbi:MAG TPA: hypothetical protein VK003_07335 [Oceanobacillus sp.]|nr:hypothetical protein [Oceanobacillus sp.]
MLSIKVQAQNQLSLHVPVEGTVEAGGSQSWRYAAQSGEVVSFLVESASGDFDPVLTITDRAGNTLISNDDFAYPESRDSLLEAITLPRTDTYTITVSGFNGTGGGYTLTAFSGFADIAISDGFDNDWQPLDDSLTVEIDDGVLTLTTEGANQRGFAFGGLPPLADVAARVNVQAVENPTGWIVGMTVRRNGDNYYLFEINEDGLWRFSLVQGEDVTVLRDWINHPNIIPGQTTFRLSLLASGAAFEFFYNDGFIGTVSDNTLTEAGEVGLMVATRTAQDSQTTAQFSDLVLTTPLLIDEARIIPQKLIVADGPIMAQALQRQAFGSSAGVMSLTVPEGSVAYARPGVQRLMLGRGVTYTNFALGATVDIRPSRSGQVGCGLVFRFADDTNYTLAFLDVTGGYGVSQRQGDDFLPGLFGENPDYAGSGTHHLLIIADEHTVYFYVDGDFVGTFENEPQEGQIGAAVVNFEGGIDNTCLYTNLWLWEWG